MASLAGTQTGMIFILALELARSAVLEIFLRNMALLSVSSKCALASATDCALSTREGTCSAALVKVLLMMASTRPSSVKSIEVRLRSLMVCSNATITSGVMLMPPLGFPSASRLWSRRAMLRTLLSSVSAVGKISKGDIL